MILYLKSGDCVAEMKKLDEGSASGVLCDPPYGLKFGVGDFDDIGDGRQQVEWHKAWLKEAYRVLKPKGTIRAFSGSRTIHYLLQAMAEVGFTGISMETWNYVNGFPKSQDVSKDIDRILGYEREKVKIPFSEVRNPKSIMGGHGVQGGDRPWMIAARERGYHLKDSNEPASEEASQWVGYGTNIKPSFEPIAVGYKK